MLKYKKIKVKGNYIEAFCINLQSKNFILLRGKNGYIMCGYLNLSVANKFKDVAIKITGVSSIEEALKAKVQALTFRAGALGVYKGQSVKDVLSLIV